MFSRFYIFVYTKSTQEYNMSMLDGRLYCRIPYEVKDMQTKKKTGFHRKTKECLSRYEALRLAKKLGCGVFYCTYSSCWHVGKAGC